MNTLGNGVSATATIPAGWVLKTRGSGLVTTNQPGAAPAAMTGAGGAIGPFPNAVAARLTGAAGFSWGVFNGQAPVLAVGPYQLDPEDDQAVIECTTTLTITASRGLTGLLPDFSCVVLPSGTTSVASDGTVLLNGASTTLTRAAASNAMFAIQARSSAADSLVVNGS